MVEFAIILPVLILFLFGIVEFGLLLYNQQVITNASREGARFGIVYRNPRHSATVIMNKVEEYCKEYLVTFGADNNPDITINTTGISLNATVSFEYEFLITPMDPIRLTAQSIMEYEDTL